MNPAAREGKSKQPVLLVSTNYLTDRVLLHTDLLPTLREHFLPTVWSPSPSEPGFPRHLENARHFQPHVFNGLLPYRHSIARHFNDFVCDHLGMSVSRRSYWMHRRQYEAGADYPYLRILAKLPAAFGLHRQLETFLERRLVNAAGGVEELVAPLRDLAPAAVVTIYPFHARQIEIAAAAKSLGIPTVAFVTSFDNLTTKTRLVVDYDGYIVWSENMRRTLHTLYPHTAGKPVAVTGPPQFDVLRKKELYQTRDEFHAQYGLDPAKKTVVYCLGSPRFLNEDYGALQLLEQVSGDPAFDHMQWIVRQHPAFQEEQHKVLGQIRQRFPHVTFQGSQRRDPGAPSPTGETMVEWVNTMRHADIIVNLCSSVALDAAIFDKPVVNLAFDPEPGQPNAGLIDDINYRWEHYKPITESGATWLAKDISGVVEAIKVYARHPERHRTERQRMLRLICGEVDGRAAERMGEAITRIIGGAATRRPDTAGVQTTSWAHQRAEVKR